jgi:hypothetical protein
MYTVTAIFLIINELVLQKFMSVFKDMSLCLVDLYITVDKC